MTHLSLADSHCAISWLQGSVLELLRTTQELNELLLIVLLTSNGANELHTNPTRDAIIIPRISRLSLGSLGFLWNICNPCTSQCDLTGKSNVHHHNQLSVCDWTVWNGASCAALFSRVRPAVGTTLPAAVFLLLDDQTNSWWNT